MRRRQVLTSLLVMFLVVAAVQFTPAPVNGKARAATPSHIALPETLLPASAALLPEMRHPQLAAQVPGAPLPANCLLYAVDKHGRSDAQLFSVDLRSQAINPLGLLAGYDIEGIAVQPVTRALYATASEHSVPPSQLFTVDSLTGALTRVGVTGFNDVADLAFRPTDSTLWGWVENTGLIRIDTATGASTLVLANSKAIDGIAWSNDGSILYTVVGRELWQYVVGDSTFKKHSSNLPEHTVSLEMRPDGLLFGGIDHEKDAGFFAYNLATSRVVMRMRVNPNFDPDDLAWPATCGNPSPGGRAHIIQSVVLAKTQVCPNEDVLVTVQAAHPEQAQDQVDVAINGDWGATRYLQFTGSPGPRLIQITATTPEGYIDTQQAQVQVVDCAASVPAPLVYIHPDRYHDLTVDFVVANPNDLQRSAPLYQWVFGDGQTTQTTTPYASHDYSASIGPNQQYVLFQARVTVHQDVLADLVTNKTVAVGNTYALLKQHGMLHPRVEADRRFQRDAQTLNAGYRIQNLEQEPISFTTRQLEYQFCDANRPSQPQPPEAINVEVAGNQQLVQQLTLPASVVGDDVCGVVFVLSGQSAVGVPAEASMVFDIRANPLATKRVDNPAWIAVLDQVVDQQLVPNPDDITEEQLDRLVQEGKITLPSPTTPATISATTASAQTANDPNAIIGQPCTPNDPTDPPRAGISCQRAEWNWAPPRIANAKKGDILLEPGCGTIGGLLRQLSPPQHYSHEGIMTQSYYQLVHSTASEERYTDYRVGLAGSGGIRTDVLRWGWPGVIEQTVDGAFNSGLALDGSSFVDPESKKTFTVKAFDPDPVKCQGDAQPSFPLVVKPVINQDGAVRAQLMHAADVAAQFHGHYRFYGYTLADIARNPAFDAPQEAGWAYRDGVDPTRATVSSTFIWAALEDAGVTLSGVHQGPRTACHPADGLYCYTEAERLAAAGWLYDETHNKAFHEAGWLGDLLTGASTSFPQQLVNCFALDHCTPAIPPNQNNIPTDWNLWQHPGPGVTVSPDDFLSWEAPPFGAYGHAEPMEYKPTEWMRMYRWAPSAGTGTVVGQVTANGAPVLNADVTLVGPNIPDTTTDGNGMFRFDAVPQGQYEVKAYAFLGPDQQHLEFYSNQVDVTVEAGVIATANIVLLPPPHQDRLVTITGHTHLHRHGHNDVDEDLYAAASVSPTQPDRDLSLKVCLPPGGDALSLVINAHVHLIIDPTTRAASVHVEGDAKLYSDCNNDDEEDSHHINVTLAEDQSSPPDIFHLEDNDFIGPGGTADSTLIVTNGRQVQAAGLTITADQGGRLPLAHGIELLFLPHTVAEQATVTAVTLPSPFHNAPTPYHILQSVVVQAQTATKLPLSSFTQPYQLTIQKGSDDQQGQVATRLSSLQVVYWNGTGWWPLSRCTECRIEEVAGQVVIILNRTGELAIADLPEKRLFLPLVGH